MSLSEWERITPKLGKMETCIWWMNHYADELVGAARLMPSMPSFVTRVEDELEGIKNKVQDAIKILHEKERKD